MSRVWQTNFKRIINFLLRKKFVIQLFNKKIISENFWRWRLRKKKPKKNIFEEKQQTNSSSGGKKTTFFKILIFWPSKQFLKSDFTNWRVDSLAKISWLVCNIFVTLHDLAYYLSMLKLLRLDCKDLLLSSQSLKQVSTFKKLNLILCIIPNDTAY